MNPIAIAVPWAVWALVWIGFFGLAIWAVLRLRMHARSQQRLRSEHRLQFEALAPVPDEDMRWMGRWLFVAGFRRPDATTIFVVATAAALVLGVAVAFMLRALPWYRQSVVWMDTLPGGTGGMMIPVLVVMPWVVAVLIASIPWLYVRAARRRRVREIGEDLPIALQVMATLARAGLGFDTALTRILESAEPGRTLTEELQTFRGENLGGIPRAQCWKRFARRLDVPSVSMFVSAMVHAEQVGGGLSNVLEHQAEDAMSRRREAALVAAHALPVKLVFPLVLCFLPGIFVWTLGPAFYKFIELIDQVMRKGT